VIHVIAILQTKPGMRDAVLEAVEANLAAVRAEDGCIAYGPAIDFEGSSDKLGPDTFVVLEQWESPEALKAHAASPHMAAFGARVKDMMVSRAIHALTPC